VLVFDCQRPRMSQQAIRDFTEGRLVEDRRIAGSLRSGSYNAALLRAAAAEAPPRRRSRSSRSAAIPLYDGDVEAKGIPSRVAS